MTRMPRTASYAAGIVDVNHDLFKLLSGDGLHLPCYADKGSVNRADRALFAILVKIIPFGRLRKLAIVVKSTTILNFHKALLK